MCAKQGWVVGLLCLVCLLVTQVSAFAKDLQKDIKALDKEIQAATEERAKYTGGALGLMVDMRLSILKHSRALLQLKNEAKKQGVELKYQIDGKEWKGLEDREKQLNELRDEIIEQQRKLLTAKDELKNVGGLIQVMKAVEVATMQVGLATLDLKRFYVQYDMPMLMTEGELPSVASSPATTASTAVTIPETVARKPDEVKEPKCPPYQNLLDAILADQNEAIDQWARVTIKDFPGTKDAALSRFHRCIVFCASEVTNLRLANSWWYGKEEALEDRFTKYGNRRTKSDFQRWIDHYRLARSLDALKLLEATNDCLKNDWGKFTQIEFQFSSDIPDFKYSKEAVERGSYLETKKREEFEKGLLKATLVALWGRIAGNGKFSFRVSGDVNRTALYHLCGTRLSVSFKETKNVLFKDCAMKCFEKVLALTKDNPYSKERAAAEKELSALKETSREDDSEEG